MPPQLQFCFIEFSNTVEHIHTDPIEISCICMSDMCLELSKQSQTKAHVGHVLEAERIKTIHFSSAALQGQTTQVIDELQILIAKCKNRVE